MKKLFISQEIPFWLRTVPLLAAIYNLAWFIWLWTAPTDFMQSQALENYFPLAFWQWLSVAVFCLGLIYLLTSWQFQKVWWLLPLGAGSKMVGAALGAWFISEGWLPTVFWQSIFLNDLLWLLPFGVVSYRAFKAWQAPVLQREVPPLKTALATFQTQHGVDLQTLSNKQPVLLVFLRHFGCTFCKEALSDLAEYRKGKDVSDSRLVLVHMGEEAYAREYLANHGHANTDRVSDQTCVLYRAIGLKRATFAQVFGWRQWWRGGKAAMKGHGIGKLVGDGFQMPGVFLVHKSRVIKSYRHAQAASVPDYRELATCPV